MISHPFALVRTESVGSTQQEAKDFAQGGCRSGTIVIASEQTAGRGRGSSSWFSSKGQGIWMTLVHRSGRPVSEWAALTSIASLAICRSLEDLGLSPQVKWPNDVLLSGKKVSGVLAEAETDAVLIGIGINLLQRQDDFPDDLVGSATSVLIESGPRRAEPPADINSFLAILLPHLAADLGAMEREGPHSALDSVWKRSAVRDCMVDVRRPTGDTVSGRAKGLGKIGDLLIDTGEETVSVANGTLIGWRST
jgi:BirA family biotin operon repressor/biotin-[acetyl-CoA-carboxylase] ligase